MGTLLAILSIILFSISWPIGFAYMILKIIFEDGIIALLKRLDKYCLTIAISIDQLGNVTMQYLFNDILIKKNGHKFGDEDETISSVLGKNNQLKTFRFFGNSLDWLLNKFEKDHSIKSIEKV